MKFIGLTLSSLVVTAMVALTASVAVSQSSSEARKTTNRTSDVTSKDKSAMYPKLNRFIAERVEEFEYIPPERKEELAALTAHVVKCRRESPDAPVRLTFICTHNSRRSHMSQLWAGTAAAHYGIDRVITYSGGTESTAFNPRAVAAMERAGFKVAKTTDDTNPIYHVRFSDDAHPMTCFSKVYDQAPNPKKDFCAVMVCSSADKACPAVNGAAKRIAIMYDDPKAFDGTPKEEAKYSERCAQIGREMLFVFAQAADALR